MSKRKKGVIPQITASRIMVIAGLCVGAVALYQVNKAFASKDPAAAEQTLQQVEVEIMKQQNIRHWSEFSGRLSAVHNVDIRPRVGGAITKVLFDEGEIVEKGTPLFVIDPRPYKASLERAKANLQAAQSEVRLTSAELKRARNLVRNKVVTKSRYDNANNSYKVALSRLDVAKAELQQAELDYEYAHIKAPVSGRISRAEITEGNVIEAGPIAPVLASIVSTDKIYAEFDVDEQTYLKNVRTKTSEKMPVTLSLTNDGNMYHGVMHSFDNKLDITSGTIRARAILDNDDGVLIPGMYANVRLGSANDEPTILVSERAIGTDQSRKYVYVVSENNKVEYREVKLGQSVAGKREIKSGIKEGDKVMVNSLQRVRPGAIVEPVVLLCKKLIILKTLKSNLVL